MILKKYFYFAFCFFAMIIALILMYKMKEGSKHLLTFMAMGVFVLSGMETKFYKKSMFFAALCVYLYSMKATDPIDYQICFSTPERVAKVEYWEEIFEKELCLIETDTPNYDDVMIWVFSDMVDKEKQVITDWQILYGVPSGFGISCCYDAYVVENFGELQSKYITIPVGGNIQELCEEKGLRLLGQDESVCVYQLR